jgi:hypothetical protein
MLIAQRDNQLQRSKAMEQHMKDIQQEVAYTQVCPSTWVESHLHLSA